MVLGHLERCCADWDRPEEGLAWALENGLRDLDLPTFQIDCFGHGVPNVTLPIGCRATISEKGFRLEEPAVF